MVYSTYTISPKKKVKVKEDYNSYSEVNEKNWIEKIKE